MKISVFLTLLCACLVSCSSPSAKQYKGAIEASGTINLVSVSGGCWVFQVGSDLDDTAVYLLTGALLPDLMIDGAQATLIIRPQPNAASVCQMGIVAEILDIVDIDEP